MQDKNLTKFVIIGYGRTRSTLLSKLLNNHPHIGCEEEIFLDKFLSEERVKHIASKVSIDKEHLFNLKELYDFMAKDPVAYMEYIYSLLANSKQVVGFKLFPEQNEQILTHVLENINIKKIILVRNFLYSHISIKQSQVTNRWFLKKGEKSEQPSVEFNLYAFFAYLKRRVNALHWILNELERTDQKYFLCFSEDIGKEKWREDIYDFLGVTLKVKTETELIKLNSDYLEERVSNYKEMVRELMYTDYYDLLYGDFFPDRQRWLPPVIQDEDNPEPDHLNIDFSLKKQNFNLLMQLKKLEEEIKILKNKLSLINNSLSYKLGYSLTRIPAFIFSIFKRLK